VLLDEKRRKEYDSQLRGKQQLRERAEKLDKRTKELRDQLQKREAAYKQSQEKQQHTTTTTTSSSGHHSKRRVSDYDSTKRVKYSDATLKVSATTAKDDKIGEKERSYLKENELREFFQEFGTIESIIVKKKKRVAYISFSSVRSAVAAMEANQVDKALSRKQRQREWSVDWASGREPSMTDSAVNTEQSTDDSASNTMEDKQQTTNTFYPNLSSSNIPKNFSDFTLFENKEHEPTNSATSGMSLEDLEALVFSKMQKHNK